MVNRMFPLGRSNAGDNIIFTDHSGIKQSSLLTQGGEIGEIISISANYTLNKANYTVLTSGDITVTLPAAEKGRVYNIKKIDTDTTATTIATSDSALIDGLSIYSMTV